MCHCRWYRAARPVHGALYRKVVLSLVGKSQHKLLSFFVRSRFLDDVLTVQICLAVNCHCRAGYDVVGVDVHQAYVDSLNDRSFASREPRVEEFLAGATRFRATTSIKEGVSHSDLIYVMVDTPSNGGEHHYDVRYASHCPGAAPFVRLNAQAPDSLIRYGTHPISAVQQIGTRVVQYQQASSVEQAHRHRMHRAPRLLPDGRIISPGRLR